MRPTAQRVVLRVVLVILGVVGAFGAVSAYLFGGSWLAVSVPLAVSVGVLAQLYRVDQGTLARPARRHVYLVAAPTLLVLLTTGLLGRSASTWIVVAVLAVGVGLTVGGVAVEGSRPASPQHPGPAR